MESISQKFLFLINFLLLLGFINFECLADTKNNSIIKFFCIENIRKEMFKANINYEEEIAKDTCDCYLEEFKKTNSHQKAINKCKLETKKKFTL